MNQESLLPLAGAFLIGCLGLGFWIRNLRERIRSTSACVGSPAKMDPTSIYALVRPYLTDFDERSMPPKALAIKSARSYCGGEFHTEFYGTFMRLYQVSEGETLQDVYVLFHWLPKLVLSQYSPAELYEHIGVAWVNDINFQKCYKGVIADGA